MKKLAIFLPLVVLLAACADENNKGIDSGFPGQMPGAPSNAPAVVYSARSVLGTGSVRFDEPRLATNNNYIKLWAYGPIFGSFYSGQESFRSHANAACILLAGPGSRYETHMDSGYVPYGEIGAVLEEMNNSAVLKQFGRFGDYDYSYWRRENSKYIQSITCANAGVMVPNQPGPRMPQMPNPPRGGGGGHHR